MNNFCIEVHNDDFMVVCNKCLHKQHVDIVSQCQTYCLCDVLCCHESFDSLEPVDLFDCGICARFDMTKWLNDYYLGGVSVKTSTVKSTR